SNALNGELLLKILTHSLNNESLDLGNYDDLIQLTFNYTYVPLCAYLNKKIKNFTCQGYLERNTIEQFCLLFSNVEHLHIDIKDLCDIYYMLPFVLKIMKNLQSLHIYSGDIARDTHKTKYNNNEITIWLNQFDDLQNFYAEYDWESLFIWIR
ncbi:unnamed protein product, partial [Didymodactylos carnosus]